MLALTMGDPAGIAGEITLGAWARLRATGPAFVVLGDVDWLRRFGPVQVVGSAAQADATFESAIPVLPVALPAPVIPGSPDSANAPGIIASIERAVSLARTSEVEAVVTNPISKAVLTRAGFPHPGHTEFLAALTGATGREVMMLAAPALRVVPVTIHVSLRRALALLSIEAIVAAGRTTAAALRDDFGIAAPRLGVAGLNPHAGEQGTMGDEERTLIEPAIAVLRADGIDVRGPYPPDTMFTPPARAGYDAALCMYHDQALIPLKTLDMVNGVNVTLGLPIVRTSPDHGTAFDIAGAWRAGQGLADPSSLVAALRLAASIAAHRKERA